MPWVDQVSGVVEAWFAGTRGAEALANLLFGDVNPSGKLPITFPKSEADLPHTTIVKPPKESLPPSEGDSWTKILEGLDRLPDDLRRGTEGRLQVVRRGEETCVVSLWLWTFLHQLRLLQP